MWRQVRPTADQVLDAERRREIAKRASIAASMERAKCSGGVCTTIDNLCSRHQMQYQDRYGRASNE